LSLFKKCLSYYSPLLDWPTTTLNICRQAVFEVSRNYGQGLLLDLGAGVEQLLSGVCGLRGVPVLLVAVGGGVVCFQGPAALGDKVGRAVHQRQPELVFKIKKCGKELTQ
jgi:hypothetical protein